MSEEGQRLAELSLAVRESTVARLRVIPVGYENWRPSPGALSFGETARHLLAADQWLFAKLEDPSLASMVAEAREGGEMSRDDLGRVIGDLERSGRRRAALCAELGPAELSRMTLDDRFGGEVTVWWVVVRGNLDHEAHHRGQLATYLRVLRDEGLGDGG